MLNQIERQLGLGVLQETHILGERQHPLHHPTLNQIEDLHGLVGTC